MQCSEFEAVVYDLSRGGVLDLTTREAAIEHAQVCAHCATLREAADSVTADLCTLAMVEQQREAPARVEATLLEVFRANERRARGVWREPARAWGLAAAVALALGLAAWALWLPRRHESAPAVAENANRDLPGTPVAEQPGKVPEERTTATAANKPAAQAQQADYFLPLPYSMPFARGEDAAVVRVRMARGALGAFGLPVNEERANEVIQVDFLVAEDGSPQAIRIAR